QTLRDTRGAFKFREASGVRRFTAAFERNVRCLQLELGTFFIMQHHVKLTMPDSKPDLRNERRYSAGELVRRLLSLAWQFRVDCIASLALSLVLLLLALLGLQLLGVVIDVIRHALDPSQRVPMYPYGWTPPAQWTPLHVVTALSVVIVVQAVARAL